MHHHPRRHRRLARRSAVIAAIAAAVAAATVASVAAGPVASGWDEDLHTDSIKITDPGIDFGDGNWFGAINDPTGSAEVEWSVDNGFYSARVTGWLHLDDIPGHHGRIHVSFWNYDDLVSTRHSSWRAVVQQPRRVVGGLVRPPGRPHHRGARVHRAQRRRRRHLRLVGCVESYL